MVENVFKPQKTQENRGMRRKTTLQEDRMIVRAAKSDPFMSSRDIKMDLELGISTRTIRRRLQDCNLKARVARKVPLLSKRNIQNHLNFAKRHKDWTGPENVTKWRNILWSDETKINLFGNDGKRLVRRPPNTELSPKYVKKNR